VALWELGTASAREIHARVGAPDGLVYTTTAKVLDRLHAKGLVGRARAGKAFVYRPAVEREVLERARARDTLGRILGPDPVPALATLVDAVESLDPELLDELARVVAARRKGRP
jgi:predicted transcriptional regulator